MSCVVHEGRLFCTTSELRFGPECEDDHEAELFLAHVWRTVAMDPRALPYDVLERCLAEVRSDPASVPTHPSRLCACGSKRMIVCRETHADGSVRVNCTLCDGTQVA